MKIIRNEAGFASAIATDDGYHVLHLQPGTERNETVGVAWFESFVGAFDAMRDAIGDIPSTLIAELEALGHKYSAKRIEVAIGAYLKALAAKEAE